MILQMVSDWLDAHHASYVPSLLTCVMLAGYAGMCPF